MASEPAVCVEDVMGFSERYEHIRAKIWSRMEDSADRLMRRLYAAVNSVSHQSNI